VLIVALLGLRVVAGINPQGRMKLPSSILSPFRRPSVTPFPFHFLGLPDKLKYAGGALLSFLFSHTSNVQYRSGFIS
jgi:hypothetical protein